MVSSPTRESEKMEANKMKMLKDMGFVSEAVAVDFGFCPFCKKPIVMEDFKDALSRREFQISGLCQVCQDKVFGG
jgi:hypothetical protein